MHCNCQRPFLMLLDGRIVMKKRKEGVGEIGAFFGMGGCGGEEVGFG